MANEVIKNSWKDAINSLHFTDTIESVKEKLNEINPEYTFEQFIKDCEAFYDLYIDFIGYNDDKAPSKNLQIQFHKVARLLNMYGHVPDQVEDAAINDMFDKAFSPDNQEVVSKMASSYTDQDDSNLQDHLAFGLSNEFPTDKVDRVEYIDGKAKVSQCYVLNIKVASADVINDESYLNSLLDLYKIKDKYAGCKFNRDNMIFSLYYK